MNSTRIDLPLALLLGLFAVVSFSYVNNAGAAFLPIRMSLLSVGLLAYLGYSYFFQKEKFVRLQNKTRWLFGSLFLFGVYLLANALLVGSMKSGILELGKFGLFVMLTFLLFQFISRRLVPNSLREGNMIWFFRTVSFLVGIHAFIGFGMIAFGWFQGNWGSDYVGGMMGHRNLWGSYLAAAIFFPMWMVLYEKGIWRICGVVAFGLAIPAIILSFSRSAWLAMLVGFLAWGLIFFLSKNEHASISKKLFGGLAFSVLVIGILTYVLIGDSGKEALRDRANTIITANFAGDESKEATGSIVFRMRTWKQSLEVIKSNPLMGIGLGNWKKEIPKYGTGSYMESSGLIMRAKPHNELVGVASETGLIGIGLFLLILILGILTGIKAVKIGFEKGNMMPLALVACLSAMFVDMLFSFPLDRVEHLMLLALAIAGVGAFSEREEKDLSVSNNQLSAFLMILVLVMIAFLSFEYLRFERHFAKAKKEFYAGNYEQALAAAEDAKSYVFEMSREGDPVELFSGMAYQMTDKKEIAKQELEKALAIHPYNARVLNAIGTLYFSEREYLKAIEYLEQGKKYMPNYTILKKNLALCYFGAKRYQDCIDICETMYIHDDKRLYDIYAKSFEMRELQKRNKEK